MKNKLLSQGVPLILTVVVFFILSFALYLLILFLNEFSHTDILTKIKIEDVLVGLTIYIKTSVDFAILIGNLMAKYNGWKNRVAIEIGTAFGNALGTMIVLILWNIFRSIEWLLVLMIIIAAFVLLKLAEEGLEHAKETDSSFPLWAQKWINTYDKILRSINSSLSPILRYIIPNLSMKPKLNLTFWGLFASSFTIPFILGLDDFAGYVPLFSIVNVFGFAIGVFAGHMLLNLALFISPNRTIKIVKNAFISLIGSIVFVGLAVWGFYEAFKILLGAH